MKNLILESIDLIHEEMKSITSAGSCGEYAGEAEYEDTKGIIDSVLKSEIIKNLLFFFWKRTSDACPLECSEYDKEIVEFEKWILETDVDKLIVQSENNHQRYCMPDNINSKEEHE